MQALDFNLQEINREATRKRVEQAFEAYRLYKHMLDEPNIEQMYVIEQIEKAVARLSRAEREILQRRYMRHEDEQEYDTDIMAAMGMGRDKYYRIKSRAFYKLAFAIRIAVMKSDRGDSN